MLRVSSVVCHSVRIYCQTVKVSVYLSYECSGKRELVNMLLVLYSFCLSSAILLFLLVYVLFLLIYVLFFLVYVLFLLVCSLPLGLCSLPLGLCSLSLGLCSLPLGLCSLRLGLCSLFLGVMDWLPFVIVALPGLFVYPFSVVSIRCTMVGSTIMIVLSTCSYM